MSQQLVVRRQSRLAEVSGWSDAQINLIRQTVAPDASRLELAWFLYNANRLGLEPTLDQIYFIKYDKKGPGEIVIGINGYRARADATGDYGGSSLPAFDYDTADDRSRPSRCAVTVSKFVHGSFREFSAEVRWAEFYPGDGKSGEQWRKRPHNQMSVRAESHALRKAFPSQMTNLEARHEAPQEWTAAADEDVQVIDRDLVEQNSKRYDEIFGDHVFAQPDPHPEPETDAEPEPAPEDESQEQPEQQPADPKNVEWERNRRLIRAAERLKVHTRTLRNDTALDALTAYNDTLEQEITAKGAA